MKGRLIAPFVVLLGLPGIAGAWVVYSTDFEGPGYKSLSPGQYLPYYADGTVGQVNGGWTGQLGSLGDGWTVLGNPGKEGVGTSGVDLVSTMSGCPTPADGSQWIDLTGTSGPGGIERTFDTHAGNSYTVTWNQFLSAPSGGPRGGRATFNEIVTFGPVADLVIPVPQRSARWGSETLTFTATTSGIASLTFYSPDGGRGNLGISDVTITDPGAAIPEPFTLALCAGGLGLALARRRKPG